MLSFRYRSVVNIFSFPCEFFFDPWVDDLEIYGLISRCLFCSLNIVTDLYFNSIEVREYVYDFSLFSFTETPNMTWYTYGLSW